MSTKRQPQLNDKVLILSESMKGEEAIIKRIDRQPGGDTVYLVNFPKLGSAHSFGYFEDELKLVKE